MMNPFMLNSFWHFMLLVHGCVLKQPSFLIPVVFTMLPSTVLFIFMFVMMSGNHFDWYINVLCGVSHGLVINVSSGVLNRLVVNVGLSMGDWLILSFCGVVLMTWRWLVVMRGGIMMASNKSFSWNHRHMVIFMVNVMGLAVIDEFDIMVNRVNIMVNWMDIMVFNGMDNMVMFNGMDVMVNRVDVVVLNCIMVMYDWMAIMVNIIVYIMMIVIVMIIVNVVVNVLYIMMVMMGLIMELSELILEVLPL